MVEQGYGRIVMTTSSGMFGLPTNLSYATAKAAVIGLTRSLDDRRRRARHQGQPHRTRGDDAHGRAGAPTTRPTRRRWRPHLVAPMVAFLAHEDCPVSGEIYAAGAGRFAAHLHRLRPRGTSHPTLDPTVEDVAEHWAAINDETGYYVPADLMGWSNAFLAHQSG